MRDGSKVFPPEPCSNNSLVFALLYNLGKHLRSMDFHPFTATRQVMLEMGTFAMNAKRCRCDASSRAAIVNLGRLGVLTGTFTHQPASRQPTLDSTACYLSSENSTSLPGYLSADKRVCAAKWILQGVHPQCTKERGKLLTIFFELFRAGFLAFGGG